MQAIHGVISGTHSGPYEGQTLFFKGETTPNPGSYDPRFYNLRRNDTQFVTNWAS